MDLPTIKTILLAARLPWLEWPSGIGRDTLIGQDPSTWNEIDSVANASKNPGHVGWQNFNLLPVHFNFLDLDANAFAFLDLPWQFQAIGVLTRFFS